jgi:DNA-binding NarL/FixJ family response regulator
MSAWCASRHFGVASVGSSFVDT